MANILGEACKVKASDYNFISKTENNMFWQYLSK